MTRSALLALTVSALRESCRKAGLPCYQVGGKRLLKADLVAMLVKAGKRKANGKSKAKPSTKTKTANRKQGNRSAKSAAAPVTPAPVPVSADDLSTLLDWQLLAMARGVDRHYDPAASRRELVSFLVATEKPLAVLVAGQRKGSEPAANTKTGPKAAKHLSGRALDFKVAMV